MRTIKQAESQEKYRNKKYGWHIQGTVPTRAKTEKGIAKAINNYFGFDVPYSEEDVAEEIKTGFIEICSDGVALWVDGSPIE